VRQFVWWCNCRHRGGLCRSRSAARFKIKTQLLRHFTTLYHHSCRPPDWSGDLLEASVSCEGDSSCLICCQQIPRQHEGASSSRESNNQPSHANPQSCPLVIEHTSKQATHPSVSPSRTELPLFQEREETMRSQISKQVKVVCCGDCEVSSHLVLAVF
jgi:hypothetical protein